MQTFYDIAYVARHLAVTMQAVKGWANSPTAQFPMPVSAVFSRPDQKQPTLMWTGDQLPRLRTWLAARLSVSDPAAYWQFIDDGRNPPGGHLDQEPLFEIGEPQ